MSIYFECRLRKLNLDLSTRPDIYDWLQECLDIKNDLTINTTEPTVPEEIKDYDRVHYLFHNEFDDSIKLTINLSDISNVYLDYTLGNKNKDTDIEHLIIMLSKYITSGDVILYNEESFILFDLKAIKDMNHNDVEDLHYLYNRTHLIEDDDVPLHESKVKYLFFN